MQCQSCGTDVPDDAVFCIECGARTTGTATTGPTVQLRGVAIACRSCGTANPAGARFCVRCGQPVADMAGKPPPPQPPIRSPLAPVSTPAYGHHRRPQAWRWEGRLGFLFLIGLAVMFMLRMPIWPGILIILGLIAFAGEAMRGHYMRGLSGVLWLFGLAFLFMIPRFIWPGILVLIGLSVLLDMARRALGQR